MTKVAGSDTKYLVNAGWDDVPHLSEDAKSALLKGTMPHLRDARSKGIPSLGAGAIFPVPESEFVVPPMAIPSHWPRVYGFDVGWKRTATIWGALDRESDVLYLYAEHYRAEAEPSIHATAIRSRGEWIHGVIDPASRGRGQKDGNQLWQNYKDLGLNIHKAENAVESGLHSVWERLSSGRLKVYSSCTNWLNEFRLYRRNPKGVIIKENDHLMDCTRYLIANGLNYAKVKPVKKVNISQDIAGDGRVGY